jgi:flagellar biogenesis protein FliO
MSGPDIATAALALLAILALVLLVALLLRHLAPNLVQLGDAHGEIRMLATRVLDARHRAVLLHCRGRDYLLVLSPDGARLIDRLGEGKL